MTAASSNNAEKETKLPKVVLCSEEEKKIIQKKQD